MINSFVTIPEAKIIKNEIKYVGKDINSALSLDFRSNHELRSSTSDIKEFAKIIDKVLMDNKPKKEAIPTIIPLSKSQA